MRLHLHIVLLASVAVWPAHGYAAEWAAPYYNPKRDADDLILPLPCGAAMTFRPVDVPLGAGPLEDRLTQLGEPQAELGYLEFVRTAFLSAPFSAGPAARRYWIGKYDVTRDQYAAMRGDACPAPTPAGRIPQTNVSWIEANVFAADWSSWLLAHARDKLPSRGDALAFARLPTEDEWEYAARGGAKVSAEDFLGTTFPMPEGIDRYVMAGTMKAGGQAQQIARALPNPLQLYDMLGNVDQMMVEPFRLNRIGRLHGQAGGIAARGGNYTMSPDRIHTAMRTEVPPYDPRTNAPTKLSTLGFRLVLSAPTLGSLPETEAAQQEFNNENGSRSAAADDPQHAIALLRQQTADTTVQHALDRLSASLASSERARADQAKVTVKSQMEAATLMSLSAWTSNLFASLLDKLAAGHFFSDSDSAVLQQKAEGHRAAVKSYMDGYLELARDIATSTVSTEEFPVEGQELQERGRHPQLLLLPILQTHVRRLQNGQALQRDDATRDVMAIPKME